MSLDRLPDLYRSLVAEALQQWLPGGSLTVQVPIRGGLSGAEVLLVDLNPPESATPPDGEPGRPAGEYILKLDNADPAEDRRHEKIFEVARSFAKAHVPELIRSFSKDGQLAMLFQVAGRSLRQLQSLNNSTAKMLPAVCYRLSRDLLGEMNTTYKVDQAGSARATLEDWLGRRLDPATDSGRRLREVAARLCDHPTAFLAGDQSLINPLWLCDHEALRTGSKTTRLLGILHGDLHGGNVLRLQTDNAVHSYWVIDYGLSAAGPLLFDHAYLELALILSSLQLEHQVSNKRSRLRLLLRALDPRANPTERNGVMPEDLVLFKAVDNVRKGVTTWQEEKERQRPDVVAAQYVLARVAAGLNWANKRGMSDADRAVAFEFAAWASRDYLRLEHKKLWEEVSTPSPSVPASAPAAPPAGPAWDDFWASARRFDRTAARFLLVTGRMDDPAGAAGLGQLPWSAVLDFDPRSDRDGLFATVDPILRKHRAVHPMGRQKPVEVSYDRGTAWMMAGGWETGFEEVPGSEPAWRAVYNEPLRQFLRQFADGVRPQKVVTVIFPGAGLTGSRLERVAEAVDEILTNQAELLVVGPGLELSEAARYFTGLTPSQVVGRIGELYGTSARDGGRTIPGEQGPVAVPVESLRTWEEEIEVLHSGILEDSAAAGATGGMFWRGGPPAWVDLDENRDIARANQAELTRIVADKLGDRQTWSIDLWHEPGAGGTTAALRTAWDLHYDHPVAILRRYSPKGTIERLRALSDLVHKPILLVAEQADLSKPARDALYQVLSAGQIRVVILYVRRSNILSPDVPTRVGRLTLAEARKFHDVFVAQTDDPLRRDELRKITFGEKSHEKYRLPFFYGLIAFERDFKGLDDFVENRLGTQEGTRRKIILYLALTTYFAQDGLEAGVVKEMLGLREKKALDLDDEFGLGPASLMLEFRNGKEDVSRIKLLHPLIAEEVFRRLYEVDRDDWKAELKQLSETFIDDMTRVMGRNSEELQRLFTQLFLSRTNDAVDDSSYGAQEKDDPSAGRHADGRFSYLIRAIPSKRDAHEVLRKLTTVCGHIPTLAHYYTHLSRHQIYELKEDFAEAEEHALKAIELAPSESIHHHTHGMVLRFWTERLIDQLAQSSATPEAVLDAVEERVRQALDSFSEARKREPEGEHGYVTPVQLIARTAEAVIAAARRTAHNPKIELTALTAKPNRVGNWLRAHLTEAHDLIDQAKHLRGPRASTAKLRECDDGLKSLYPHRRDELIQLWSSLLRDQPTQDMALKRGLIRLYRMKYNDNWPTMPQATVRQISFLLEDSRDIRDVRTWIRAYRWLPEFSYIKAISHVEKMAHLYPTEPDPNYFLYILLFLHGRAENKDVEDRVLEALKQCQSVTRDARYRYYAYEFLAPQTTGCPIVNFTELGKWDPRADDYPPEGAAKLKAMTGVIDKIDGPERGWIRLGPRLRAFFPPRNEFTQIEHAGREVEFYLGFTYDGFRAYGVRMPREDGQR